MRFDKETRTQIREAAPGAVTIKWPAGAEEPQKGRTYRVQSLEEYKRAKEERIESPDTCREVLAQMHERPYGKKPEGYKPPRRRRLATRALTEEDRIIVLDVEPIGPVGRNQWEATVALHEPVDPIRHLRVKARVPAGPHPIEGHHEKAETEPEQIIAAPSRTEREDEDEALRVEHVASIDSAEIARLERKLTSERRRGKPGNRTRIALERAKKRAELDSAAALV
jgi:hypothetical protein